MVGCAECKTEVNLAVSYIVTINGKLIASVDLSDVFLNGKVVCSLCKEAKEKEVKSE